MRRFPGSRKQPNFSGEVLGEKLHEAGIDYHWLPDLGGRRRPSPNSSNYAWINSSFRGYADYMETASFHAAIEQLIQIGESKPTAIMCSEAVWWKCHRALIADYLKSVGMRVLHIMRSAEAELHPYTSAARIINGALSYDSRRDPL